jgi:tetratricopeptide (TPR) repeat protein
MTEGILKKAAASVKPAVKEKASSKGLDAIIVGTIAAVFLLIPVFFTGMVSQGIGFEKLMLFYFLVLLGVVAWVTKGVVEGELKLKRTPLDLPISGLLAVFSIATVLSVNTKDSLIGSYGSSTKSLFAVIIFIIFYYLIVNNLDIKRIKLYFWCLIASTSLVALYAFAQLMGWFVLPADFTHMKNFNSMGSLSALTMFLTIFLPILVVAMTQLGKISPNLNSVLAAVIKIYLGAIILLSLVILALLNGFAFWPIAIGGMVIILMFFLSKVIKTTNNNLLIPLFSFLALIILLVLGNFNFVNLGLPSEVSLSRGSSWEIAKNSLKENPLFGTGLSTFTHAFSKYRSADFNNSPLWNIRFDNASGSVFELLATVGVLGLLSVLIVILIVLSISFLTLIKANGKDIDSVLLGLFAGFVSAIMYSVLFPMNNSLLIITAILSIFTISTALIIYPEKFKLFTLSFRASANYALALAAIFLCVSAGVVVLFTMGLKLFIADVYAKNAFTAANDEEKVKNLSKSISLAPYQDIYYLRIANTYMGMANQAAMSGGDQTAVGNYISQAIEKGKKGVDIAANKAANNESLALIYENASFYTRGALEWSETLYNEVAKLDPQNPTPYLRLALVNMARSNAETDAEEKKHYINEAIKMYDKAIEKKNDLAPAYYGKAIAYEKLENKNEAIELLKKANLTANNNLDYRFELARLYFNRGVTDPKLSQNSTRQIAEQAIFPEEDDDLDTSGQISVTPSQPVSNKVEKNEDLKNAEQLFVSILIANPQHVNAMYSLAVLYQKVGDDENAKILVDSLLERLSSDEQKNQVREQFKNIL